MRGYDREEDIAYACQCTECSAIVDEAHHDYVTKDSGERIEWSTGSRRDTNEGKPRYDLIGRHGMKRVADLMARGAVKYGENNWAEGQSVSRSYESAFRHLIQFAEGDAEEDHLAAVVFNIFNIIHVQEEKKKSREGFDALDDMYLY